MKGRLKANPVNSTLYTLTLSHSLCFLSAFSRLREAHILLSNTNLTEYDCKMTALGKGGRRVLLGCFSWLTEQESPAVETKAPLENISSDRQQVIDPAHVNNILSFFKHLEERRLISLELESGEYSESLQWQGGKGSSHPCTTSWQSTGIKTLTRGTGASLVHQHILHLLYFIKIEKKGLL